MTQEPMAMKQEPKAMKQEAIKQEPQASLWSPGKTMMPSEAICIMASEDEDDVDDAEELAEPVAGMGASRHFPHCRWGHGIPDWLAKIQNPENLSPEDLDTFHEDLDTFIVFDFITQVQ